MDAARRVAHVLGAVGLAPLARGDEEVAIGEQEARAEVAAAVVSWQGDVDLLHILQARADEPAAGDRGGRIVIVVGARIGEVGSGRSPRSRGAAPRRAARPGHRPTPRARPATGSGTSQPSATMRSLPGRSVTSIRPSGRKARPQGMLQPVHHLDQMEAVLGALERAEPLGPPRAGRPCRGQPPPSRATPKWRLWFVPLYREPSAWPAFLPDAWNLSPRAAAVPVAAPALGLRLPVAWATVPGTEMR